jgi:alkylation response protein AidB-like acyl-CoA dehydrogenase
LPIAFALTEPGAGSDVAAIKTTAQRDGDAYVIDGTKRFTIGRLGIWSAPAERSGDGALEVLDSMLTSAPRIEMFSEQ